MSKLPYPSDGGLKKQVRALADTPSAFAVVAAHFCLTMSGLNGARREHTARIRQQSQR